MAFPNPDPEMIRRMAAAVDLPLEADAAEELAAQFGVLASYAELLESLELEGVEPAGCFSLEAPQP